MRNIVILGAGFGGLKAALVLGRKARKIAKVTLIDRNKYHTYTPLLYEISTTSKETANYLDLKSIATYSIERSLKGTGVEFIEAEVEKIDISANQVALEDERKINYDYLIIALGSETNFFDIPGLQEKALGLKTFNDAVKIRDTVWETIEGASSDEAVDIVIGGAGSTGVELAGEIQEWIAQLRKEGHQCRTGVTLIDAAPTILNNFDPRIIKKAVTRLKKLGANIITEETIEKVKDSKLFLKSGKIMSFDILVWTGGVKANAITAQLPLKTDKQGRVETRGELLCVPESPNLSVQSQIYGIGDIVCVHDSRGKPVPMVARAAILQGSIAAKNIIRDIKNKKNRPKLQYSPADYPYIIPIGGKYALAKIGPIIIGGFFGWIAKGLVELRYLDSIMPLGVALKIWIKGLRIFIQNDRLG